jgi:hypothetical protein
MPLFESKAKFHSREGSASPQSAPGEPETKTMLEGNYRSLRQFRILRVVVVSRESRKQL